MFPEQKLCSLDDGDSAKQARREEITGLVSGDKLRAVGRAAVFGTYRLDFLTAQAFGNVELEELLCIQGLAGVAVDEKGCPSWVYPDDRKLLAEALQKACESQEQGRVELEYRVARGDGSIRWVLDCGQILFRQEGTQCQPVGMSGILLDIDDRKKAERALRDKDERLMMALSAAGAGTFRWNIAADEVELDAPLARLLGVPGSRLIMPLHEMAARLHPDDRPGFIEQCWQAVENNACFKAEFRVVLPDGSIRWLMDNGQLAMDGNGQPVCLTGTCVDITSRKQVEDQLRASEARLRSALAVGQMGTWELFLDTGIIAASEGADRLCGLENLGTRPLSDYLKLIHPDDLPLVEGVLQSPPTQFRVEVRVRPRGSERTIWVALQGERRLDKSGKVAVLTGAVSDISSLKQTESLLQKQTLELEARVRELNCLYSVSRLVQQQGDLDRSLQQVVDMIPVGFARPDNIGVRLIWEGGQLQSAAFEESPIRLTQELKSDGQVVGSIEIYRSRTSGMDSFSYAEQTLVQALAKPISRAIERKKVLQALSDSEDRWRTMTGALAEGVVLYDQQARILAWNRSAERLLGAKLSKGMPTGLLDGSTIREDGTPFPLSEYPTLVTLNTGAPCNDVMIGVVRGNSQVSWLSVNTRPLFRTGEKEPYAVVASFADITERKLTEETIRREIKAKELERSRLNTVLQALPVAVFIADADGKLLQVNAAAEELWGQPVLSTNPEHYHQDYKAWWGRDGQPVQGDGWGLARSIRSGEAVTSEEMEIERTDGTRRTILNYSLPFYSAEGDIAGGVAVSVDISERKRGEAERALLAAVVKASPDAIVSMDLEGRVTSWNSGAERMYGYRADEVLGKSMSILMPADRLDELDLILDAIAKGEGVTYFDSVRLRKDGSPVDVSVAITPITDAAGKVVGASKIDRDISERKRGEAERALLAAVVKASPDAIVSTDLDGRITSWNSGAERMYGYCADEILGKSISILMPADRQDELDRILGAIAKGEGVTYFDSVRLRKDGSPVDVSVAITPITDVAGKVVGASKIDRDISERKRMEEQLHHDAFHDRLTGVANRSLFMDRLEHVVARAQRSDERFAVFVMDMDNFKLINDSFGHLVGDQLLITFVERVQELLRPADTLSRFGGDEFTLLLEEVESLDAVEQIAARILDALQKPFLLGGQEVKVSSSIGIMLGGRDYQEPDRALRDADVALYEAKKQGKNQYVVFDARMRGEEVSRLYLESELRRALQEVDLTVQYQPIVDLQTGAAVGCEALVRWKHPVMGRVDPSRFINVAEETGLITPLGRFVFDKACGSLADWLRCPDFPPDFYISVNMSPKEFYSRDLMTFIESTLSRYGLSGSNIRLEITENVIIQHDREAAAILHRLKDMGIRCSMDDFGTGYSSLSYLHQLPFDVIKVDRSFIQRLSDKKQSREIVRTILGLAQALDMQAVAEGAETPEQLEQLRSLGFRWVQGYILYKPLDRAGIRELFDSTLSA